jgi:hypothetical protein
MVAKIGGGSRITILHLGSQIDVYNILQALVSDVQTARSEMLPT